MQIVCPNCTTAYDVPAAKFGGAGRSVRCARCRTVWVATAASEPVKKVAATDAVSSVALAVAEEREGGEFDWSFRAASTEEGAPAPNAEPADAGGGAATQDDIDAMWAAAGVDQVDRAPPLVPAMAPEADARPVAQPENIETVAARRAAKAKKTKKR